jgi:PKD repeat protein
MHTYTVPGAYTVSLTIANDYGNNTAVGHIYSGRNAYYQGIGFSAGNRTAYRQDVTIHRTTGSAYEEDSNGLKIWHIYVGDHCRADYGDVRFADAAGARLAYYLRPGSTASQAQFYVQLAEADQPGTLKILYGDVDVTTAGATEAFEPASGLPPAASAFSSELQTAAPPSASFTGTPIYGLPHAIRFTDTSTNYPTAWNWTFGDGGTSTEQNPVHTYVSDGTYTVSLTATNEYGSDTVTESDFQVVTLVVASITVSPSPAQVNLSETRQFTAVAKDQMGT